MQTNNKKSNKKIGIITFHFPVNVGAVLQSYALQQSFFKLADCDVISYEPFAHAAYYKYWAFPVYKYGKVLSDNSSLSISSIIKAFRNATSIFFNKDARSIRKKIRPFLKFKKRLKRTKVYYNVEQLQKIKNKYDLFVVGSDQVWSDNFLNDKVYFLNFIDDCNKKASYAISAGDVISDKYLDDLLPLIKEFKYVSVREKCLQDQLLENGISVRCDLDPTLLLTKEDYKRLESKINITDKYIFVYSFHYSKELEEVLNYLKQKLNCKIVGFVNKENDDLISLFDINYKYTVGNFLALINNAEFVVTSSFHGTAFSVIYNKKFIALPSFTKQSRIENFLSEFGLSAHYYSGLENICDEYPIVNELFDLRKKDSKTYLENIIKNLG